MPAALHPSHPPPHLPPTPPHPHTPVSVVHLRMFCVGCGAACCAWVIGQVVEALRAAGHAGKMQLFVDGGVRRGTDVVKALALGATAVGVGRPVIYSLAAYGQQV
jgi:hypothetical protein